MTQIPSAVADIRARFRTQLRTIKQSAHDASKANRSEKQRRWMHPDKNGWSGDLFDWSGMEKPFDPSENWDDYIKTVSDKNKGVGGDFPVCQIQGDWLAVMERAFRARHTTRCRAEQHSTSRLYGHGHSLGIFNKSILGYLKGLVSNSKNQAR